MAGSVHVKATVVATFKHRLRAALAQFQIDKTLHQYRQGGLVGCIPFVSWCHLRDGGSLRRQDQFIEVFLWPTESTIYREGTTDVGSVAIQLTTSVN